MGEGNGIRAETTASAARSVLAVPFCQNRLGAVIGRSESSASIRAPPSAADMTGNAVGRRAVLRTATRAGNDRRA